jgi:SpoU rRNA methylase family enzyme
MDYLPSINEYFVQKLLLREAEVLTNAAMLGITSIDEYCAWVNKHVYVIRDMNAWKILEEEICK